jgi:hypothetical protein
VSGAGSCELVVYDSDSEQMCKVGMQEKLVSGGGKQSLAKRSCRVCSMLHTDEFGEALVDVPKDLSSRMIGLLKMPHTIQPLPWESHMLSDLGPGPDIQCFSLTQTPSRASS